MRPSRRFFSFAFLLVAITSSAVAGIQAPKVDGDEFTAHIELTPGIEADLTVRFENTVGLTVDSLGVSVETISLLDTSLLSGMDALIELPAQFPVKLTIDPPADGGFAFEGVAEIELYTQNLQYVAGSPLRLFAQSPGEEFRDITAQISGGSYRTRGSSGGFSTFVILVDPRPLNAVVDDKFDAALTRLDGFAATMTSSLYNTLRTSLLSAQSHWQSGQPGQAVTELDAFSSMVRDAADNGELPRVWRSGRDLDNVAGTLRERADTLRFSLTQFINFAS